MAGTGVALPRNLLARRSGVSPWSHSMGCERHRRIVPSKERQKSALLRRRGRKSMGPRARGISYISERESDDERPDSRRTSSSSPARPSPGSCPLRLVFRCAIRGAIRGVEKPLRLPFPVHPRPRLDIVQSRNSASVNGLVLHNERSARLCEPSRWSESERKSSESRHWSSRGQAERRSELRWASPRAFKSTVDQRCKCTQGHDS